MVDWIVILLALGLVADVVIKHGMVEASRRPSTYSMILVVLLLLPAALDVSYRTGAGLSLRVAQWGVLACGVIAGVRASRVRRRDAA